MNYSRRSSLKSFDVLVDCLNLKCCEMSIALHQSLKVRKLINNSSGKAFKNHHFRIVDCLLAWIRQGIVANENEVFLKIVKLYSIYFRK